MFTGPTVGDDTRDEMLITLYRTDSQGHNHYYSLNDRQGHLFSSYTFTVTWGPSLSMGNEKQYTFETRDEMDRQLQKLVRARIREGYRVLYSYFRAEEYAELKPTLRRAAVS